VEGKRKRQKYEVEVGPNGDEIRQTVRRDRREYRESVWEGKVQNRRTVTFETIQQQEGERKRRREAGGGKQEEGGRRRRGAGGEESRGGRGEQEEEEEGSKRRRRKGAR